MLENHIFLPKLKFCAFLFFVLKLSDFFHFLERFCIFVLFGAIWSDFVFLERFCVFWSDFVFSCVFFFINSPKTVANLKAAGLHPVADLGSSHSQR